MRAFIIIIDKGQVLTPSQLTDKVFWLKGVKSIGEDSLGEGEPTDLSASVSIPYCHDTGTEHDC